MQDFGQNATLLDFFREWFPRPEQSCFYQVAVDRWRRLTGNPPVSQISERTIADFQLQLKQIEVARRFAPTNRRRLSPYTVRNHVKTIRLLLARLRELPPDPPATS